MPAASAAARCMPVDVSLVTALCSSTAAAVDVTYSLTPWMAFLMLFESRQHVAGNAVQVADLLFDLVC